MSLDNYTRRLAEYTSSVGARSLPPQVVHDFKRALLDYSACILAGTSEPVVRSVLECVLDDYGFPPGSPLESSFSRLSGSNAAFVNGVRAHALDLDDGYTQGSCHPGAVIFPAALAAAKKYKASPDRVISAVVLGYDVMLRISAAAHPTTAKHGFHNTAVAGVFGAAAATAVVMGFDLKKTVHTLGLAASFSGGILEFLEDGSDAKRLHAGKAARDGLLCAEMAARGISGPSTALEGKFGFFNAFARGEIRPEFLEDGLGQKFLISNAYFKLYPCCRHYHAAIDAACLLRQEKHIEISQIQRVEIGLYGLGVKGHDQKTVHTLLEAQMSAPCAVALALLDQSVTSQSFGDDSLSRQQLKELMLKTETIEDPLCEKLYPAVRSGVVSLQMKTGERHEYRVQNPRGEETNPLSDRELEEKLAKNAWDVMPPAQINDLISQIWRFESSGSELIENVF